MIECSKCHVFSSLKECPNCGNKLHKRYIPKKKRDEAPCCPHCTSEEYDSVHHLIPFALCHNHLHIIKLCRRCHIKYQFSSPHSLLPNQYGACFICGEEKWLTAQYTIENNQEIHICENCRQKWIAITNKYRLHLLYKD